MKVIMAEGMTTREYQTVADFRSGRGLKERAEKSNDIQSSIHS